MFVFFKQKTAYELRISDWSSDVGSSDLLWAIGRVRDDKSGRACGKTRLDRLGTEGGEHRLVDGARPERAQENGQKVGRAGQEAGDTLAGPDAHRRQKVGKSRGTRPERGKVELLDLPGSGQEIGRAHV